MQLRFDLKISRIVGPTATALLLFGIMAVPAQAHAPGVHLTGLGAAEINGVLSPGEWNNAGTIGLDVNLPGGGTTPGTLFVMNDDSNPYLAVRFARPTADPQNYLSFYFDNDNDGLTENGDDFSRLIHSTVSSTRFMFGTLRNGAKCLPYR